MDNPIICPRCGSYMVLIHGSKGDFYGCINYPYCSQTVELKSEINNNDKDTRIEIDDKCPKCGARMVKRKGKRGEFYGCRRYPECRKTIDIREISKYIKR